jgi:hypothetical protein
MCVQPGESSGAVLSALAMQEILVLLIKHAPEEHRTRLG